MKNKRYSKGGLVPRHERPMPQKPLMNWFLNQFYGSKITQVVYFPLKEGKGTCNEVVTLNLN